jgi:hypothetical protein
MMKHVVLLDRVGLLLEEGSKLFLNIQDYMRRHLRKGTFINKWIQKVLILYHLKLLINSLSLDLFKYAD